MIIRKEVIGGHTLILGDSKVITPYLAGQYCSVVTDPPYGMLFRSNYRKVRHEVIRNDENEDLLKWACNLSPAHSLYVWMRWDNLICSNIRRPKSLITWVKNNHGMGDLKHEHARKTEVCAFYPGESHVWPGKRPSDVVTHARTGNKLHPTQKPVSLMQEVIGWTEGAVLDPFMGSGSTLVACQLAGRTGIGIELDPEYFETACRQVEAATKQDVLI